MATDNDYIFGTHDAELQRLGLQSTVWRPRATDAWRRAGIGAGHTVMDIGCGPGFTSLDLSDIVGSGGRVHAIDRSKRFLDYLNVSAAQRGITNITTHEVDLDTSALPDIAADAAWCRWVFAFLSSPRTLLERVHRSLNTNGVFVFHEYFDYSTWRMIPRSEMHEEFVREVMASWRAEGGEPDIGIDLAGWCNELGFEIKSIRPIVEIMSPTSFIWQWPKSFIKIGLQRLVDIGRMTKPRADALIASFELSEAMPGTLLIAPGVLEVIAVKR